MTTLPLISIITVTYNAEKYIEQTIQGILAQTYSDIEYIIIDSDSTDRTMEIITDYKSQITNAVKSFKIICEKDNGLYDAMNKGIIMAQGKLIGMVNASDYYEPNAVETIVDAYAQNKDTGIFHGNVNMLNEDGSFFKIKKPDTNLENLHQGMSLQHPTFFVAKSVYEKYGLYDLQYKIAADFDFAIRCNLAGVKFFHIDSVISNFRKGGVSSKREKAAQQECKNVLIQNGYSTITVNTILKEWRRLSRKNSVYYISYKILKYILPVSLLNKIAARASVKQS
jgi:Glycosyltransferases involved in cell wall biogenesis